MNEKTDCTVIMPSYNAENTIERALESLFSNASDQYRLQVIVVDDGSTDRTSEIVSGLKKKYRSLELIRKENGGVSSTRNTGLKNARGHFVYFMDSDDEVCRPVLEELIEKAYLTKSDLMIASYEQTELGEGKKTKSKIELPKEELLGRKFIVSDILPRFITGRRNGLSQLWNKLYLRERITEAGLSFNTDRIHGEDWEFNIRYLETAETMFYMDRVLYFYSSDGMKNPYKYRKGLRRSYILGVRLLFDMIENYSLTDYNENIRNQLLSNTAYNFISILRLKDIEETEKKELLNSKEAKLVFSEMADMDVNTLYAMHLSLKDRIAFRLLSKGLYRIAIKIY